MVQTPDNSARRFRARLAWLDSILLFGSALLLGAIVAPTVFGSLRPAGVVVTLAAALLQLAVTWRRARGR